MSMERLTVHAGDWQTDPNSYAAQSEEWIRDNIAKVGERIVSKEEDVNVARYELEHLETQLTHSRFILQALHEALQHKQEPGLW